MKQKLSRYPYLQKLGERRSIKFDKTKVDIEKELTFLDNTKILQQVFHLSSLLLVVLGTRFPPIPSFVLLLESM